MQTTSILVAITLGLIVLITKITIDIYMAIIVLRKDKELLSKENKLENAYQFIKGLY